MAKPDEENAIWSSWIGLLRFGQKSDSSEKESEDEEEESEDEEEEGRRRWREKKRREGICKCRVRRNSRFAQRELGDRRGRSKCHVSGLPVASDLRRPSPGPPIRRLTLSRGPQIRTLPLILAEQK